MNEKEKELREIIEIHKARIADIEKEIAELPKDNSIRLDDRFLSNQLCIRSEYEYKDKAIWLSSLYNWELKKDSVGNLCLIPTKKGVSK